MRLFADRRDDKENGVAVATGGAGLKEAMQQGIAASEAGDKTRANAIFQQVAQQYPNSPEVWVWLGWTSFNIDSAEAAFMRAREVDPTNEEAALGMRWVASQRADEPRTTTQPALEESSFEGPQFTEQAPPHEANIAPVQAQVGLMSEVSGMSDPEHSAMPDLSPRASASPNVEEMMQNAISVAEAGNKVGAYKMFEHLASIQSTNPEVWVWLGGTSPNLDEAETAFKRACELDPGNEKGNLGLRWVALRRQVLSRPEPMDAAPTPVAGHSGQKKENAFSRFFRRLMTGN